MDFGITLNKGGNITACVTDNFGNKTTARGKTYTDATRKLREQFASKIKQSWELVYWTVNIDEESNVFWTEQEPS